MSKPDVVVVGASAGGIDALHSLVAGLPAGLLASVLIVVHTAEDSISRLPDVLAQWSLLPAAYAVSGQHLTPGLLTVAPPRHHLILTAGDVLRLHSGPLVHRTRPAVDPLMVSAARTCGDRVIAVVLSGAMSDGADGAAAVAAAGGEVLVQDPADARSPGMPLAALAGVPQAAVWPASKLGSAIADLVTPLEHPPARVPADLPAPPADGVDEALWLAVSQLQAYAAAHQRLQQQFGGSRSLVAQSEARVARALHAAELITTRVLPAFLHVSHPADGCRHPWLSRGSATRLGCAPSEGSVG